MVFKKKDKFFSLLRDIAVNLQEAAYFFADLKIQNVSDLRIFSETMKEYEVKGDTYVHEMIQELNRAFITPIEREDILHSTMMMDDVLDGCEETSALLEMYSITNTDEYMAKFANTIKYCTDEILKAIELLEQEETSENP